MDFLDDRELDYDLELELAVSDDDLDDPNPNPSKAYEDQLLHEDEDEKVELKMDSEGTSAAPRTGTGSSSSATPATNAVNVIQKEMQKPGGPPPPSATFAVSQGPSTSAQGTSVMAPQGTSVAPQGTSLQSVPNSNVASKANKKIRNVIPYEDVDTEHVANKSFTPLRKSRNFKGKFHNDRDCPEDGSETTKSRTWKGDPREWSLDEIIKQKEKLNRMSTFKSFSSQRHAQRNEPESSSSTSGPRKGNDPNYEKHQEKLIRGIRDMFDARQADRGNPFEDKEEEKKVEEPPPPPRYNFHRGGGNFSSFYWPPVQQDPWKCVVYLLKKGYNIGTEMFRLKDLANCPETLRDKKFKSIITCQGVSGVCEAHDMNMARIGSAADFLGKFLKQFPLEGNYPTRIFHELLIDPRISNILRFKLDERRGRGMYRFYTDEYTETRRNVTKFTYVLSVDGKVYEGVTFTNQKAAKALAYKKAFEDIFHEPCPNIRLFVGEENCRTPDEQYIPVASTMSHFFDFGRSTVVQPGNIRQAIQANRGFHGRRGGAHAGKTLVSYH